MEHIAGMDSETWKIAAKKITRCSWCDWEFQEVQIFDIVTCPHCGADQGESL